jgi:hypothetical protein
MKYYFVHVHGASEVRATILKRNNRSPAEIWTKYVPNAEQYYLVIRYIGANGSITVKLIIRK